MLKIFNICSQAQGKKIEEKTWKNKVWNQYAQNLDKSNFESHFSRPKPWFFRDFGNQNKDGFLTKQPKQKELHVDLPNPPQS